MSMRGWDIQKPEETVDDPAVKGRLRFFRLIIVLVLVLLLTRVYWLQQTQGEIFITAAEDNQLATLSIDPDRGVIFDRDGDLLAENVPSFDVTITPAFLPREEEERMRVFNQLSLLTGVPVTNTVQQEMLRQQADPAVVSAYTRLAELYNVPADETLDEAGVVPQLPDSIMEIYQTYSFAQYLPAVITTSVPVTLAYQIAQESVFLPGVRVIPRAVRRYPSGEVTSHIIGFMGPLPDESWLDLGYERDDRVGWAGLEVSMEEELSGIKGERVIEVDWTGRELRQVDLVREPLDGLNLHLTLDLEVQEEVYNSLVKIIEARRNTLATNIYTGERYYPEIEQGAVVVLNVNTGEVLAMVNIPTFDNNRFATEVPVDYYLGLARNDYEPLLNHAIAGQYPPGSTFKIVTAAGALQAGVISPNRELNAPGTIRIPNRFAPNDPGRSQEFVCWVSKTPQQAHGLVNMLMAIAWSCDIYFYKITGGFNQDGEVVERLGVEGLHDMALQFGFGQLQGIELPTEAPGNIPTAQWKALNYGEPWSTGDDYNSGIGQGYVLATPMQQAQMAAIVANGGFLYQPTIIHHMTDQEGNLVVENDDGRLITVIRASDGSLRYEDREGKPVPAAEVTVPIQFDENGEYIYQPRVLNAVEVDRRYLEIIAQGMRLVNEEDGTGSGYVSWFDEYGLTTAGKTGTAEFCDNIAIKRQLCTFDQIQRRQILPTHSWYVGYAPYENPEIAAVGFVYNGDEGSQWAAPAVREAIRAYFDVGTPVEWNPYQRAWVPEPEPATPEELEARAPAQQSAPAD
ncbi:MAG: penicillin-binding protein 2 [Candidatus Promineifilaceae bacterium]|nr:penicillin-binding protein 2 [Candidatus Promineifilaceae bacterium]